MDRLAELKTRLEELYNATEPPGKVEVDEGKQLVQIEDTQEPEMTVDVVDTKKEDDNKAVVDLIEKVLPSALTKALSEDKIADAIRDGHETAIKKLTGKVE